eukprot:gene49389-66176_t
MAAQWRRGFPHGEPAMSERSRFIKVRVSDSEYRELRKRADEHGVTMSEHVRDTVTAVHQATDVAAELSELRGQVRHLVEMGRGRDEPSVGEQREMLLLLRELAAARDAQILARVRAQLAARGGQATQRGAVWCVLAVVITALAWTAVWERGLSLPALDGWRFLASALTGRG